jgi:UDP-N-acetylmuramate dehydrogenase
MLNKADLVRFSKIVGEDKLKIDEPMSKHSSFRVGGPAELFLEVDSVEKLKAILEVNKELKLPITVIGNGTNILVKDKGIKGIVIKYVAKGISKATLDNDTFAITADAGLPNAALANELLKDSLTGFEFAASIPGTIGGAIYMNAGAFGGEMENIVSEVTFLDLDDLAIYKSDGDDCDFGYRHSKFENMNTVILSATMVFNKGDKEEIKRTMDAYLQKRLETQPYDKPNAGSTFKRGDGFITAMLIDEAGLKGHTIGGAQVSEKHAGFIVNTGNATAKDILDLIKYVQKIIMEKYGKAIEPEVRILG